MHLEDKELHVDSVEFCYDRSKPLLTGAFLCLSVGDVVGLLGRNGTGKSTLMRIVFGTVNAHYAYIRVNGKKVRYAYGTGEVCMLPQDRFLPTSTTVRSVIKFMIKDKSIQNKLKQEPILARILDHKINDIAGGELRFLEILLILNQPATFILLDEPFNGLSPVLKERIQELILEQKKYKGLLISDHDYLNVLEVSNQLYLLENGGCRKIQKREELEYFYVPEGTFGPTESDQI